MNVQITAEANDEIGDVSKALGKTVVRLKSYINYIDEILVWVVFSNDKANGNIRGSIRSRGPVINTTAALFGGGGHMFASGVRMKDMDAVDKLIEALDEVCQKY